MISFRGGLSSAFVSDAGLGVFTVLVSWTRIIFNLLIVLQMHLTVNCDVHALFGYS